MCFTVLKGSKRQQAKRNITVYKVLEINKRDTTQGLWSPHNTFLWEKGKVNTSIIGKKEGGHPAQEINKGFHSLQTIQDAKDYKAFEWPFTFNKKIFKFIIPKGAYYYKNDTQYVSSRLILKSDKPIKE